VSVTDVTAIRGRAGLVALPESSTVMSAILAPGTGMDSRGVTMNVLYTAQATAIGGREGRVRSSDGALNLDLAIPRELGGPGGVATNPEQLFAAGFAACFENAIRLVARRRRLPMGQASVTARVGIGPTDIGGYQLAVELHAQLPDLDHDTAQEIVDAAHQVCPYSNAVRGNVDVVAVVDPAPDVI
jgi:lipoyl-dependent peroxiredoxin